jgi:hypothetical protein
LAGQRSLSYAGITHHSDPAEIGVPAKGSANCRELRFAVHQRPILGTHQSWNSTDSAHPIAVDTANRRRLVSIDVEVAARVGFIRTQP